MSKSGFTFTNDDPWRLFGLNVQVKRSQKRNKSIAISVSHDSVVVRAPVHTPDTFIAELLRKRRDWIEKQSQRALEVSRAEQWPNVRLRWFGIPFSFHYHTVEPEGIHSSFVVARNGDHIDVYGPAPSADAIDVRNAVIEWYKLQAMKEIGKSVQEWAHKLHCTFNKIAIKDQKTRWGSCSSRGNLNFNWRLVMAPRTVMEYVVVHELCHLRHMNHSPAFWRAVDDAFPQYQEARQWLRQHGRTLYF